jgi:light-regulated signal transduction histidine kinase (bacteriophytochrome)
MDCNFTKIGQIFINLADLEREFDWQQHGVIGLAVKNGEKMVILDQNQKRGLRPAFNSRP